MPSEPTSSPTATTIDDHIATLRALLRLFDPTSPFQPILLGSIDLAAWLAVFQRTSESFHRSLASDLGNKPHPKAVEQFFRLVHTLCEWAEVHARDPKNRGLKDVPEIASFSPASAMYEEDADAIDEAHSKAAAAHKRYTRLREILLQPLTVSTSTLKKTLAAPNGVLRLMKRRPKTPLPGGRTFPEIAADLQGNICRLPTTKNWTEHRDAWVYLRHQLKAEVLPHLDRLFMATSAKGRRSPGGKTGTSLKTGELKSKTRRDISGFLAAHAMARSLDDALPAMEYPTLFHGLLDSLVSALVAKGICSGATADSPRVIDDIRRLPLEVVRRNLTTAWDGLLTPADEHATEVVLAALHHLETSSGTSLIYGFSDNDLATWIRSGDYAGADPLAERSKTKAAEKKRVARTLQHLLPAGAAFHDRRLWTPPHRRNSGSSQHRLWTVNPLLALLPRIAARLACGIPPAATRDSSKIHAPTHRNRGTRLRRRTSGA